MSALQSKRIMKAHLDRNVHHDQRPRSDANGCLVSERMTDASCASQPIASAFTKESATGAMNASTGFVMPHSCFVSAPGCIRNPSWPDKFPADHAGLRSLRLAVYNRSKLAPHRKWRA